MVDVGYCICGNKRTRLWHDVEECILITIHAPQVYRRAKENMLREENEEMQCDMQTLLSDMAVVKGKLQIGMTAEIVIA